MNNKKMIKVFKGKLDLLLNWIDISLLESNLKFSDKVKLELLRADTIKAKEKKIMEQKLKTTDFICPICNKKVDMTFKK